MTEDKYKDIWAQMMAQPRPHKMVPLPRKNPDTGETYEIAMVVLTAEESSAVTAAAEKKVRTVLKDAIANKNEQSKGYDELFKNYCAEGILYRCCKNPDDLNKPFFPTLQSIFQVFSVDEVGIMLNHYYDVQISMGPIIGEMTQEEADLWMKRLVEGGTQANFLLNSFSLAALKELIQSMAVQLKTLQTDKSSPGAVLENTTSTTM